MRLIPFREVQHGNPQKQVMKKFEKQKLALLYQEETKSGEKSNFNKLVSHDTADRSYERKAN